MTKDRPRNRPPKGQKHGSFGGSNRSGQGRGPEGADGKREGFRGPRTGFRDRPRAPSRPAEDASGTGGNDKPWGDRGSDRGGRGSAPQASYRQAERKPDRKRDDFKHQDRKPRDFKHATRPHDPRPDEDLPRDFKSREDRPLEDRPREDRPRDRKPGRPPERKPHVFEEGGEVWIWGLHSAGAALKNTRRQISRAVITRNAAQRVGIDPDALPAFAQLVEAKEIDRLLPSDAVHQGLAVRTLPMDAENIEAFVIQPEAPLVILDQVTDPQNVGAVFRSAAAFGIGGVVLQTRNAPALGGALAKAAAGAIEAVAEIRTVNISRAIEQLTEAGWNVVGLDGSATETIGEAFAGPKPLAIVMGAEGAGLRPGVAASCSKLARIPIGSAMESLNVSNAAAIAFYEASRRKAAAKD